MTISAMKPENIFPARTGTCNDTREATVDKQDSTPVHTGEGTRTKEAPRSVVVELASQGAASIRKAPPDTMVMVVDSKTITASGRWSVAAGGRGPDLAAHTTEVHDRPSPRQIPVSFPG